ncbi:MAG TPA: hypothetical protein DCQ93_00660 [Bacteroidetes bacterium]|nr:hypothetical protein [Bacteroidota bacterium]
MKTINTLFALALMLNMSAAFSQSKPTIAVAGIDSKENSIKASTVADLLRLELEKTDVFTVMDKYEVSEVLKKDSTSLECYSRECLVNAGKKLKADKMISGSLEIFGNKIVITLKLVNVKTEAIEKTDVKEFLNLPDEIQNMIQISVKSLLGLENDELLVNTLLYFQNTQTAPTTTIHNNGPRMGVAYVTGDMGKRLQDGIENGGYDAYPVLTQFGYQSEVSYLSAGNFRALFETMFMVDGLEQQMFIPSLIALNGFRDNKHGWEFAFGPTVSVNKIAVGYYDQNNQWKLSQEFNPYDSIQASFSPKYITRIDRRGQLHLVTGWVWAIGKTFRSGYLNIPVNAYVLPRKEGWYCGLSVGFNVRKKTK